VGASDDFCIALYEIRNLLSPEIKKNCGHLALLYPEGPCLGNTTRPATESPLPFEQQRKTFPLISPILCTPLETPMTNSHERIPINLTGGSHIAPNTTEKANLLNNFFSSLDLQTVYCPIRTTFSLVSKVLERIIHNHLSDNLTRNNLLSSQQFGFRLGFPSQEALLTVTNDWHKS